MRLEAIALMQTLADGVRTDEILAGEASELAAQARAAGEAEIAAGLLSIARNHRVRAMELRGRLAGASAIYDGVFHRGL